MNIKSDRDLCGACGHERQLHFGVCNDWEAQPCRCEGFTALVAAPTPETPSQPLLRWEGPDEDGDWIVYLEGIETWHLAAHGATRESALARLGEAMLLAYDMAPNAISGDPPGSRLKALEALAGAVSHPQPEVKTK